MNKSRGFTIIELIVVIAIIAVLAAIVLVNVTAYINKGKDASIKGNMSTIATTAAVFYEGASDYTGLAANLTVANAVAAITSANEAPTLTVAGNGTAYCIESPLHEGTNWCVDSTGYVGAGTGLCIAGGSACQSL